MKKLYLVVQWDELRNISELNTSFGRTELHTFSKIKVPLTTESRGILGPEKSIQKCSLLEIQTVPIDKRKTVKINNYFREDMNFHVSYPIDSVPVNNLFEETNEPGKPDIEGFATLHKIYIHFNTPLNSKSSSII
ncbi:hypothetical protein JTB14_027374 [Gonioctena quinquepunctata]|nr:hypothetical protein JTB14_027374 [Gonioctena quinquepunctata]